MQISRIRGWQFDQSENNMKSILSIVQMSDPEALTTYRDNGTGWTVLQVLCHLRDFDRVYYDRVNLAVEQDNPTLPMPNPDELAAERRYSEQKLDTVLAEWEANRAEFIAYLRARADSDWERTAMHPTRGQMTLLEQLCLAAMHDTIHLEQITRILNEKKLSAGQ